MKIDVGPVQSITTKSGDYGWGFMVKDSRSSSGRAPGAALFLGV
jgi:hypothetical protein